MPYDPHEHEGRLFHATVEWERQAPRPLFILNGGAALAALTFVGNSRCPVAEAVTDAMLAWLLGLLLAAIVVGAGYRSQSAFLSAHRRQHRAETQTPRARSAKGWGRIGVASRIVGYVCWCLSLGSFGWGAWDAINALGEVTLACRP
ncbi:MAG: hypothetical protein WD673_15920 [Alphaproteobacteria bacterium]